MLCEKGQLSHRPPILYVPVVDIVMSKEEPQIFKIKLPDTSHLSMPIYSRGNNEEYLAHIVAVLRVIEQKGLPVRYLLTHCTIYLHTYEKYILPGTISNDLEGSPLYHRTTHIPKHITTNNVAHNIATTLLT
jgi:hypothetical protein